MLRGNRSDRRFGVSLLALWMTVFVIDAGLHIHGSAVSSAECVTFDASAEVPTATGPCLKCSVSQHWVTAPLWSDMVPPQREEERPRLERPAPPGTMSRLQPAPRGPPADPSRDV